MAEVRARVPPDKEAVWRLGPSTRPHDLPEQLRTVGFREPRDGTPALVTQADPATSYPILRRLEPENIWTIRRLEDPG